MKEEPILIINPNGIYPIFIVCSQLGVAKIRNNSDIISKFANFNN